MNIGLMFVHEPIETNRQAKQRETDKLIEGKLGSSNIITNFIAYITGTIGGPIISFFRKNGFAIAAGILSTEILFFGTLITTFLILGILIILMNIGLMFVHEPIETNRQAKQDRKSVV